MSYKDTERERRNPVERLACPMCGWIRTVSYGVSKTGQPREVRFDKMELDRAPIWRLDRLTGKGRGSKEATIELVDSKTLAELPAELKEQIERQCHKILEILE
ncbi:unnamed protein product [marine sediment metagenome]|uniref:Uncharacterized protein n=1 Tax=marine sediment metagenome TaxID=412755 RepID=X1FF63_9ZZZZ